MTPSHSYAEEDDTTPTESISHTRNDVTQDGVALTLSFVSEPLPPSMSTSLLICSLGNPGVAYATTRHSAGHVLLSALRSILPPAPPLESVASFGKDLKKATIHDDYPWTLWQSPAYMNVSGPAVLKGYKSWLSQSPVNASGRLVIVHDELERPLGSITVRQNGGSLSARGHNGLKSCIASLRGIEWVRIGVGIGRPESRSPEDVSQYVLKKLSPIETQRIEDAASELKERLSALR